MLEHGLVLNSDWLLTCDWSAQDAAKHAMKLFLPDRMPTAIVAASDEIAIGVMAVASQLGLRVPQDLSVVGVDDYALSDVLRITTVRQDVVAQGRAAANTLLHDVLAATEEPAPPRPEDMVDDVLTLPTHLVPRRTSSPLRRSAASSPLSATPEQV
jgi:DNA-binding LacI/PurR family transcriptional regulator